MANVLPRAVRFAIVRALVEGCSIARMRDVDCKTASHLLARLCDGCALPLDQTMRDPACERQDLGEGA